jgi:Domain of unknown function (DUF6429)
MAHGIICSIWGRAYRLVRSGSFDNTAFSQNAMNFLALANLHLNSFTEGKGEFAVMHAWKAHDWHALDRLYQKGFIGDPKNKNKSVAFTETGRLKAEELFRRLFCD